MLAAIDLGGDCPAALERLPAAVRSRFEGLVFATEPAPGTAAAIAQAVARLAPAAGVRAAVGALVRAVHVLAARPGYDCSHSDPGLPFSIFVSVPMGERDAELRLAESILHETMHLQLSLIERETPIVQGDAALLYSPWQDRARPVAGLVHGLYVFACILDWFDAIERAASLAPGERDYFARRRADIRGEIGQVADLPQAAGLTPVGRVLSQWLIDRSLGARPLLAST